MKILLAVGTLLLFSFPAWPAEQFGTVDAITGSAYIPDPSGKPVQIVSGQVIYEGQTISSGPDGEVHIVTEDGGMIAVRPDTVFRVDEYKADGDSADKIFMSLFKGAVRSITGWIGKYNSSAYRITTPSATVGVRGTDHETVVIDKGDGDEPGTYDTVNEGATVLDTQQGRAEVTPGKFAFAPRSGMRAPYFLDRRPRFFERRHLRNEGRIRERRELLRTHLERSRARRIEHLRELRGVHDGGRGHRRPLREHRRRDMRE